MSEEENEEKQKKCPKCDSDLHYIDKADQHFCFSCEEYHTLDDTSSESQEEVVPEERAEEETLPEQDEEPAQPTEEEKPMEVVESAVEPELSAESEVVPEEEPIEEPEQEVADKIAEEKEEQKICPGCGSNLTYIEKYDRWYCYSCKKYAPLEPEEKVGRKCPECDEDAEFIDRYKRWYCWSCRTYLPKEGDERKPSGAKPADRPAAVSPEKPVCPECGKPATWVAQYDRYYCYPCSKYLPKETQNASQTQQRTRKVSSQAQSVPKCPDCGRPAKWIAQYSRYYCYPCKKYLKK